jgi:cytochrome c oxidase cbb3-type subunit 4
MTYQVVSQFAQTWGLVFLVAAFVLAVAYALWPSNRKGFDRAARRPLEEEAAPIRNDELRK